MKTETLGAKVPTELKARFEESCRQRGVSTSTGLKQLVEASLAPPPDGPTVIDIVRQEVAVVAVLLLSAMGRVGSTEEAVAVVKGAYISGVLAKEVLS